ncbi:hypothetical protein DVH24_021496 [Malus domestica]|uniref:Uncharacterized protein n=1 Tax=Malus domestica TaxID=3750 RepID=A0A498K199_MALDO|nr:hypothetical protein DVH24_021496 [Malus domestica]
MHTNTTKRQHEVLTSLLSNFTNRKDKLYWILQFILAYYTSVVVIMYEDFLTDNCGWVNWYLVGKFVKKDFYALELFEKMSEEGSEDKMEITNWRDLYSFENTRYIWNPSGCTIIVKLLEYLLLFTNMLQVYHQLPLLFPFDHVVKAIENVGIRWIVLPIASILFLLFDEKSKRQSEDTMGTYFDLVCSLESHLESNFGTLAIDLHAAFYLWFTRNLDFWPIGIQEMHRRKLLN